MRRHLPTVAARRKPTVAVMLQLFTAVLRLAPSDWLPHTGGLVARAGIVSCRDAQVVANLKRAGAVLLGSTNISELGMWWDSDNPVYGRTSNPYDTRRSPGGSSGGEAALLCACGTPLSVGTDTGGSIRTPAFFCGLFGHKPTAGVVSVRGCNIHQDAESSVLQCPGPLARHAADLRLVLGVLAGERGAHALSLGQKVNPGGVEVFSLEGDTDGVLTSALSRDLLRVQRAAARHFQHTYDCTVKKVRIPGLQWSYQIWREKLAEETQDDTPIYEQLADNKGEINVGTEITRWLLGRPRHTLASLGQALLAKGVAEMQFLGDQKKVLLGREAAASPSKRKAHVDAQWKALQMRIQRLLGHNGVLLYPSHPTQAPYHGESLFRPLNFTYSAIFNALGFPVTQVPLGLAPNGLPLGIQIVGGMHQDHLTIAMAEDLERHFGGWVCPSRIL
ncbi:Fatty-acid amide hydrolase 2 [Chionoecetes opilio]|uniref:Fatty-acid amide hydrolase 2 n=1 Tax=Chionoecetes opilio TaxID=41210 RepID=A0A8J4XSA0_CHIOP|nr:Fatty-acid amide hydrolase 2 [Chionoecetes opilio]